MSRTSSASNMSVNYSTMLTENSGSNLRLVANRVDIQNWGAAQNSNLTLSQILASSNHTTIMTMQNSNIQVTANILPTSCNVFDLGSSNFRFRDLYLSGDTIDLDGVRLSKDSRGGLAIQGVNNTPIDTTSRNVFATGNIGIGTTTALSLLHLHGANPTITFTASSGQNIINVADNNVLRFGNDSAWKTHVLVVGDTFTPDPGRLNMRYKNYVAFDMVNGSTATERMRIIADGNVGIGTATPLRKLHVQGDINFTGSLFQNNSAYVSSQWTTGTASALYFTGGNVGVGTTTPLKTFHVQGDINFTGDLYQNNSLYVSSQWTTGTASALYYNDGNVGLGTTTPVQKLVVIGNVQATGFIGSGASITALNAGNISTGTLGVARGGIGTNTLSSGKVLVGNGTGAVLQPTNLHWNNTSTRLGIGNANPQEALHVTGNILSTGDISASGTITASNLNILGDYVTLNTTTSNTEQMVVNNAGTGPALKVIQSGTNTVAEFYDAEETTPALFIANSGSIGIGTSTPLSRMHVIGDATLEGDLWGVSKTRRYQVVHIQTSGTSTDYLNGLNVGFGAGQKTVIGGGEAAATILANEVNTAEELILAADNQTTNSAIRFVTNVQAGYASRIEAMTILGNGNVGIGVAAPTQKLQVSGTVLATAFSGSGASLSSLNASSINAGTLAVAYGGTGATATTGSGNNVLSASPTLTGNVTLDGRIRVNDNSSTSTGTRPSEGLYVWTDDAFGMELQNQNSTWNTTFVTRSSDGGFLWKKVATPFSAADTGTFFMYLNGSGNLGIGTTNPTQKLRVEGNILSSGSIDAGTQFLGRATDTVDDPSYSWTGDTNVGMYRPDTDTIGFVTAGSEKVRIASNGNVGIGTNNPLGELHILESTGTAGSATSGTLVLEHNNSGGASSIVFPSKVNRGSDYAYIRYEDHNPTGYFPLTGTTGGENSRLTIGLENDVGTALTNAEHMVLRGMYGIAYDAGRHYFLGNVGIGSATPIGSLDISSSVNEYPPNAMTANTTNITTAAYGNGSYIASASSQQSGTTYLPYGAFNKTGGNNTVGTVWISASSTYNGTTGAYVGSVNTDGYLGEWLQIQLPKKIVLRRFSIQARNTTARAEPRDFRVFGSLDGTKWVQIFERTGETAYAQNDVKTFDVDNAMPYNYYRLVTNAVLITGSISWVSIAEWRLFDSVGTDASTRLDRDILYISNPLVGIGTTTPMKTLHVVGNAQIGDEATDVGANNTGTFGNDTILGLRSSQDNHLRLVRSGVSATDIFANSSGDLVFSSLKGSTRYDSIVFREGNVGIGTTNPTQKLRVEGTVSATEFSGSGASLTTLNASRITAGTIPNANTSAVNTNTANTIVLRDGSGNFSAGTITATFSGNGSALTNLNATNISAGTIANARTSGVSTNTVNTLVLRDGSGNFSAGTITATLTGTATGLSGTPNITVGTVTGTTITASTSVSTPTITSAGTVINCSAKSLSNIDKIFTAGSIDAGTQFLGLAADTATAPSFSFTGDLTTGMWRNATGSVSFTSAGTECARISRHQLRAGVETNKSPNTAYNNFYSYLHLGSENVTTARTHVGSYVDIYNGGSNFTASNTIYAAYNRVFNGLANDTGASLVTAMGTYNYIENQAGNLFTENYITNAYGCFNRIYQERTGSITNTYGTYNDIQRANGTMTTAYGMYNRFQGTIGTSWGIYSVGEQNNYLSGNLGIGTATVNSRLHVQGNILSSGSIDAGTQFLGQGADTVTAPSFSWTGDTNVGMYRPATDTIGFTTNGTEKVRIASDGNVGIGTATVSAKLHVSGKIYVHDELTGVPANGVLGGNGTKLVLWPGDTSATPYALGINGSTLWYGCPASTIHAWYVGTGEVMRINASGNVGIGTANPTQKLRVQGNILSSGSIDAGTQFLGQASDTQTTPSFSWTGDTNVGMYRPATDTIGFTTNGTEKVRIALDGNVGIGTNNPLAKLAISGDIIASGDITAFGTASDARLKTNVKDLESSLETLCKLRPVEYQWRDDIFNEAKRGAADVGFIAQEVEEVLPLVTKDIQFPNAEQTYKGIEYDKIIPYLTKAIQELVAETKELKAEVLKTNAEIAELKARLQ